LEFYIQEIDLETYIEVKDIPDQCHNCVIELKECKYQGPIFTFGLVDDFYEQFVLKPHLVI